jgi:hypothetical protein
MKTSHTIQNFLQENNPEKLKEFVGLFNPAEPELINQYNGILNKQKDCSQLTINSNLGSCNNFKINENLFSIISSNKNNAFVLHKFNNDIKILYQGYDSENECSGELHFFANKLFLASYSYPKLLNGNRIQFLNNMFGFDISKHFTNEYISIKDDNQNTILIENCAVLKVHCLNKDTLQSLHQ